jgi:uncharacterized SAM-binding protein YcdF (DUF218 family)
VWTQWFYFKKLLTALVLPPSGPLLLAALGLALLGRLPRLGRALAWGGVLVLAALSLPTVAQALLGTLNANPALDPARARDAQAIVIVGAGVRREAPEYGGDTLGDLTLERVRYGAWLARRTGLPILVTGGSVYGGTPEADLMKEALEEEFGVKVKWVESGSRNTHQNATDTAPILLKAGVHQVILIAHSFDMVRDAAEFRAAGLRVIPAPIGIPDGVHDSLLELMPSMGALEGSYYALYELLANAVRSVSGVVSGPHPG